MSRPDLDAIARDVRAISRRLHDHAKRRSPSLRDDIYALETTVRILLRVARQVPPEALSEASQTEEIQARLDGVAVQMGLRG